MAAQRTYLAIDLKSFYASVECVDRHLDPLTTNLVVADASRTEKTICLAVSPSLKAYKIPGRARLFEAVQRVKEVNAQRLQTAIRQKKAVRGEDGKYHFASTSFDANALNADPALGLSYIVAPPRMQRYLDVSTQIYKTYLKYVSPADIYPYSIDEVFIDVTGYLPYYHMSAHELAMTMVREVLYQHRHHRNGRHRHQPLPCKAGHGHRSKAHPCGQRWCPHCGTGRAVLSVSAVEPPPADGFLDDRPRHRQAAGSPRHLHHGGLGTVFNPWRRSSV